MKINVLSLFPKMFESPFSESMIKRARENNKLELAIHDLRKWAWNDYGAVDDKPFGGGVGMLIRVDVVAKALDSLGLKTKSTNSKIVLTSARGKKLTQSKLEEWSKLDNLTIICGHYEGIDQRVGDFLVDEEVSIGDYILTGGELAAMVMIDGTTRLLPGVLGKDESSQVESFSIQEIQGKKERYLEYPQYTRPQDFQGLKVPEVLLSGDLKKIKEWQLKESKASNDQD